MLTGRLAKCQLQQASLSAHCLSHPRMQHEGGWQFWSPSAFSGSWAARWRQSAVSSSSLQYPHRQLAPSLALSLMQALSLLPCLLTSHWKAEMWQEVPSPWLQAPHLQLLWHPQAQALTGQPPRLLQLWQFGHEDQLPAARVLCLLQALQLLPSKLRLQTAAKPVPSACRLWRSLQLRLAPP